MIILLLTLRLLLLLSSARVSDRHAGSAVFLPVGVTDNAAHMV